MVVFVWADRLVGLVVKMSASGAEDPEFDSAYGMGIFWGQVILTYAHRFRWNIGHLRPQIGSLALRKPLYPLCEVVLP